MDKIYKDNHGADLTFARVRGILNQGLYIETIKTLRCITSWGLREAKDAVDQNCSYKNVHGSMAIDYDRAVKYFEQFFKPSTEGLLETLKIAIDHWETLGYASPVKACEAILINFGLEVMHPARG